MENPKNPQDQHGASVQEAIEAGHIPEGVTSIEQANYLLKNKLINDRIEQIVAEQCQMAENPVTCSDTSNPRFKALEDEKSRLLNDSYVLNANWNAHKPGPA